MSAEKAPNDANPDQACVDGGSQEPDGGALTDLLAREAERAPRGQTTETRPLDEADIASQVVQTEQAARSPGCLELATIKTSDGTELAAAIHTPQSRPARGAVIFVHGFCGDKSENGLFRALASHCVEEGFAAVLYDWRGIADSKGDFPSSTLRDHTADFAHVVRWTKSRFNASTEPIHAVGFSLGAAVIGLASREQSLLASIAYLSPASRPSQTMWPRYNSPSLWSELREHGVVKKPGGSVLLGASILESLRDTDLGKRAFDLNVPLLVCHGTDDLRIECAHSRELVKERIGRTVFRYKEFEGASHSFRPAEKSWAALGKELTGWFEKASLPSSYEV